jgi:Spy/CpxP family protein refolding chaperone
MNKFLSFALVALLLPSFLANAQSRRNEAQRPASERIESFKKVRMMEAMKLDENQSVKLFARYNDHQDQMKSLERESNELFDKLESQIRSNASEGEYQQTIGELRSYEKKRTEERQRYFNELKDVLTPKQLAEYMVFERNFARDLREAVRDVKIDRLKNH